ncbi:MAG TPA: hypothetical protein VNK43_07405 [Gemmatimonadales bacterium]|nr:hypothetical protein [Gemmatimonadales bacterium]
MRATVVVWAVMSLGVTRPTDPMPARSLPLRVIVHESNPVAELPRAEVSRLFLKRTTRWADGRPVQPVDQAAKSPVHHDFCRLIHGRQPSAVRHYWQQMIFSGRAVPPPEKASDAEVLAFVRANPGAVGYVSAAAPIAGVRELTVTR